MIFASVGSVRLTVALNLKLYSQEGQIRIKNPDKLLSGIIHELGSRGHRDPKDALADGCPEIESVVTDPQGLTLNELRDRGYELALHVHVMEARAYVEELRAQALSKSGYEFNALNKEIEMVQACGSTHVLVALEFARPSTIVARLAT